MHVRKSMKRDLQHPCEAWKGAKHSPRDGPEVMRNQYSENNILEMFIDIRMDTECNETNPAIAFDRFREYFKMFRKMTSHFHQNYFLKHHKTLNWKIIKNKLAASMRSMEGCESTLQKPILPENHKTFMI